MTRIVEILVAINAIAAVATFLGLRYAARKLFWGRFRRGTPPRTDLEERRRELGE